MASLITEALGLYGWTRLEPVLLAALATEEPILLVGPHGSAKSFILERLAESLGLIFRCYNASLINYDDLVGIPMPSADRRQLEYITTDTAIWDAGVVFIDELNRTRPELQNKLFPIIHDRRIQGKKLERLRYRWAAMNPPSNDEDDPDQYLGAERLDPALADRFPFVVSVPDWRDLSERERRTLLIDQFAGRHDFPVDIACLIADTRKEYRQALRLYAEGLSPYIITLVDMLIAAGYTVSTRRATMLLRTLLAIHAARCVLTCTTGAAGEQDPEWFASAKLALLNSLPDAAARPLDYAKLAAIAKEAWTLAGVADASPEKRLLKEPDLARRLELAVVLRERLRPLRFAELVGDGLGRRREPLRRALALAVYLAVCSWPELPASCVEMLAQEIHPVFDAGETTSTVSMHDAAYARLVAAISSADNADESADFRRHRDNLLNSFLPDGYQTKDEITELATYFKKLWEDFGL
jgi:MoxR-like ATPase